MKGRIWLEKLHPPFAVGQNFWLDIDDVRIYAYFCYTVVHRGIIGACCDTLYGSAHFICSFSERNHFHHL